MDASLSRDSLWSQLDQSWDLIVVGGGITGAGVLREAARAGLRVLLLEARDYAAGTSSRSSKLVHGGFRYLRNAQLHITLESVRERERLLREGKGLVNRLGFLFLGLPEDSLPVWIFGLGLAVYDLLAAQWQHQYYDPGGLRALAPPLSALDIKGGYRYFDALTDDARLVLRLIREAQAAGGLALNYARVEGLLQTASGQVCGVAVQDQSPSGQGRTQEIRASVVVNATGAWGDELRGRIGRPPRLRGLRGGHLVFPGDRLPLSRAVSFLHPADGRPVFAIPWEGITLMGTTDVDHPPPLPLDPAISPQEVDYLLAAVQRVFPDQKLTSADIQATFAGIRAVVDTGKANPSRESREHVLWSESGLLTVSGGKLTTFRLMARDALRAVASRLPDHRAFDRRQPVLDAWDEGGIPIPDGLDAQSWLRLAGRYGAETPALIGSARPGELTALGCSPALCAELRWAARIEQVVHLEDLMLRRVRLGLLLPHGGLDILPQVRSIVQPEMAWDEARWDREVAAYRSKWRASYAPP